MTLDLTCCQTSAEVLPTTTTLVWEVALAKSYEIHAHVRDQYIYLDEDRHVYIYTSPSGSQCEFPISVSGVWSKYFEKFQPSLIVEAYYDRWAMDPFSKYHEQIQEGREHDLPDEKIKNDIMEAWTTRGAAASRDGTYMHKQIELALGREPFDDTLPELQHFLNWVREVPAALAWRVFRTEWSIFSRATMVAGQIDALFQDPEGCQAIAM